MSSEIIWEPSRPAFTLVEDFRRAVNRRHGLSLRDYHDFHRYSVDDDTFWMDLWVQTGIVYSQPPLKVNEPGPSAHQLTWFPGARLNFAENLLYRRDDGIACTAITENGSVKDYSYMDLRRLVQTMASAMRANGLVIGDRVAAVITNSIDAVVIALAAASIGAIYTGTSPDMGPQAILERYEQVQPKFIFMETEIFYAGKTIDLREKCSQIISSLTAKGLKVGVTLPGRVSGKEEKFRHIPANMPYSEFLSSGHELLLTFEQLPFQHPWIILYSSGTTGKPKCIVHSAGGILLQLKKELAYSYGINRESTFFQYTTTGWMMWVLLLNSLSWGGRIVLYDGSPFHPNVSTFLKMISDQGVTATGLSPKFLSELRGRGIKPREIAPFEGLQSIAIGGAILTPDLHRWAQDAFGKQTRVFIGMGGTDVCTGFLVNAPCLPVRAGEMTCKVLGMKVEVFDGDGRNIEHTGNAGEMVVTKGHPSVPLFFWGDENGEKFKSTYFDMYSGVWRQGDFIQVNPETKGWLILSRSDGVLNRRGIRFGTGEIYTVLEQMKGLSERMEDAICVGQRRPHDTDERVILFIKMRQGYSLTKSVVNEINAAIKHQLTSRHLPDFIVEVQSIPYTTTGKKIEIAVKQIVSGVKKKPSGAVANPESLEQYYKYYRDEELERASQVKL